MALPVREMPDFMKVNPDVPEEEDEPSRFENTMRKGNARIIRADPQLYEAHERLMALLTAPDLPAGTGREQSYVDQCICSIAEDYRNLNHEDSAAGGDSQH